MTLPQVYSLFKYWSRYPPTNELTAAQMGWKDNVTSSAHLPPGEAMTPEDMANMLEAHGGRIERRFRNPC